MYWLGRKMAIRSMLAMFSAGAAWTVVATIAAADGIGQENPKILRGHRAEVMCLAISPDGKTLASGSKDETIRVWDLPSGKLTATLRDKSHHAYHIAFSPDGKSLITGSYLKREGPSTWEGAIKLWDLTERKMCKEHVVPSPTLFAISRDGRKAASACCPPNHGEIEVEIWDTIRWKKEKRLVADGDATLMELSPDGKYIAVSDRWDKGLILWDVQKGERVGRGLERLRFPRNVESLAFRTNGSELAVSITGACISFEVPSGRCLRRADQWSYRIAYSWDNKLLALVTEDDVKLVDATDFGADVWKYTIGKQSKIKGFACIAFCPVEKRIVVGGEDGNLYIWTIPSC